MKNLVRNAVMSGTSGALLSFVAAAVCSRIETGCALPALHAVSHIAWNDRPESHHGRKPHNLLIGHALHHGASIFWAGFFETFFGRVAERSSTAAAIGGATIATAAFVTDYHVVARRFTPGFEGHVGNRSLFAIYAALAAGLALSARLRGLRHHQVENDNEGDERRHPQRSPQRVIAPE
jgi:hypothetical protein